jgi:alpha-tubulin suppressor-like RCC1 family protein
MPETSSYSGIEMADIAKISGQDAPSGGEASEPTSGFLTIGGPYEQNNALRHGSDDKGTFQEITFHSSVTSPPTVSQIRKVKPGRYHIGMLDSSGNLYMTSTGSNGTGVSSIYGGYNRQFVIELTGVADFDMGKDHALAVKTNGTLWGIGPNSDGELGRGNTSSQYSSFAQIGTDTNWSKVACGDDFSIALKTTGALYSAGKNQDGRTGQGTTSGDTTSWTQIGSDTDWTFISAGEKHCAAIKGGKLMTWGDGGDRRLGNNSTSDETSPYTANSDTDWQSVFCGGAYTKAIKTTSGHHYHAGTGGSFGGGTRGDGSTSYLGTFTRIGSDTGWQEFINLTYSSFTFYAWGKKSDSFYVCGRVSSSPYIKTGGTATTSNTTTFVELADPAPSYFILFNYDASRPEAFYLV